MVGGARGGSWFGLWCWVGGSEDGSYCFGGARLSTLTCLPQDHVSGLLPWRAKVKLFISYERIS